MESVHDLDVDLAALEKNILEQERKIDDLVRRHNAVLAKARELNHALGLGQIDRPEASPTSVILDAAEAILREAGSGGLSSSRIWERLESQGIYVAGKNPASNLSAKLSQAKGRFVSGGPNLGWRLASASAKPSPTLNSHEPSFDGAAASL